MPRPKSYDREDAVAKACLAFWQHGYQALGVRELEQIAEINQFAIRSEFGGKEGLLLEALAFYSEAAINGEMARMKDGGIAEISAFLRGLVTPGSATSSDFGCLIVNTGVENARVQSPRLEKAVQNYWSALERYFRQALENARDGQEDSFHAQPADVAKALVSAVMGIHAQNRALGDQTAGKALVDFMCTTLENLGASK